MWHFAVSLPGSLVSAAWDDGLFVVAAFVVGAIAGSFLNVVGHRVPVGRSVVAGRSACPACGHPVRARDNVPVLSWLALRGRCRDCGVAIPPRYALVEAGCGLALAALAAAEIVAWRATGASLPLVDRTLVLGDWRWLCGWAGRVIAVLAVVAWALLARGGHVVTRRAALATTAVVTVFVSAASPSPWWGAAAAVGGAATGWAAGWLQPGGTLQRSLVLVGAAGGWEGVIVTVGLAGAASAGRRALRFKQHASTRAERESGSPFELAGAAVAGLAAATLLGPALARWFRNLSGW